MSNKYFQQFCQTLEHGATGIMGQVNLVAEAKASLVNQGVTYTADVFGTAGNSISIAVTGETLVNAQLLNQLIVYTAVAPGYVGNDITIAFVGGGTAGAEVVNVTGTDIEVEIEDGVSDIDDIVTAINGEAAATALISISGSGSQTVTLFGPENLAGGVGVEAGDEIVTVNGNAISIEVELGTSTVDDVVAAINGSVAASALIAPSGMGATTIDDPLVATNLAGGTDGVASTSIVGATAAQTGVGEITITLADSYAELISAQMSLVKAVAQDLIPQIKSYDVASAKTVVVNLLTGATPTDPDAAAVLQVDLWLRNSSVAI